MSPFGKLTKHPRNNRKSWRGKSPERYQYSAIKKFLIPRIEDVLLKRTPSEEQQNCNLTLNKSNDMQGSLWRNLLNVEAHTKINEEKNVLGL